MDKVGSDFHVATIFNNPNGLCDTHGSFTLTASNPGATVLANATFFRADATGTNLNSAAGHFSSGVWSTQMGAENVPGNFVAHLFLSTLPDPGPSDFLALSGPVAVSLSAGANTIYYFGDGDDMNGGTYGFGLNLWLNDAAAASPDISVLAVPHADTFDIATTAGCSPAFDGSCGAASKSSYWSSGDTGVSITSFSIDGVGGASRP